MRAKSGSRCSPRDTDTLPGTNCLSHWTGFTQPDVEPWRVRRKIEADGSPIPQPIPFDQEDGRTAGFPTSLDKPFEYLAEGRRFIERANGIGQARRLPGAFVPRAKRFAQLLQFSTRGGGIPTSRFDVSQCRFDIFPRRVELLTRRLELKRRGVGLLACGIGSLSGGFGLASCRVGVTAGRFDLELVLFDSAFVLLDEPLTFLAGLAQATLQVLDFG